MERCKYELFVEKYFGLSTTVKEDTKLKYIDFGEAVDLVCAADQEFKKSQPSTVLGWVDVKDRLPETNEFCMINIGHPIPIICCYKGDGKFLDYSLTEMWDIKEDEDILWMPLPTAPNKSNSTPTPTNEI